MRTETNAKNDLGIIPETLSNMHELMKDARLHLSRIRAHSMVISTSRVRVAIASGSSSNSETRGRQVPLCGPFSWGIASRCWTCFSRWFFLRALHSIPRMRASLKFTNVRCNFSCHLPYILQPAFVASAASSSCLVSMTNHGHDFA